MSKRTTGGRIGYEVADIEKPESQKVKTPKKAKNPKKQILSENGLPTSFTKFNDFELLDILYYLLESDVENPMNLEELQNIESINDLKIYKQLEAIKRVTEFHVRYTPKSEYAKNIKCPKPGCGNIGANLLAPEFRSVDEAPLRFYRCTKCNTKFN